MNAVFITHVVFPDFFDFFITSFVLFFQKKRPTVPVCLCFALCIVGTARTVVPITGLGGLCYKTEHKGAGR